MQAVEQDLWRQALDGVAQPVVAADAGLHVRFLNAAAERMLGTGRTEALDHRLDELIPGDYAGSGSVAAEGWRVVHTQDGWVAYGDLVVGHGAADAWLRRLIETEQLAAVGQLAAGVAHEIGAPLTAISVAVEYLLRGEAGKLPGVGRDLELILAQTQRIARLARRLVDLARPGELALTPIDLNRVVSEGFELVEKQLRRNGIEADLVLDPALHPMLGDPQQLQQVLLSLVLNAQRAVLSPEAGVRQIRVLTRATADANELVVTDEGPGIADEDHARIFLPFFSRSGGTGLGLPMARSTVHRHGGEIRVESRAGQGATFIVSLPIESDDRSS